MPVERVPTAVDGVDTTEEYLRRAKRRCQSFVTTARHRTPRRPDSCATSSAPTVSRERASSRPSASTECTTRPLRVHVYDSVLGRLSRLRKSAFTFSGELYQLLLHLPNIGRHAIRLRARR